MTKWSLPLKIAFRFFFIFLSLQALTESFFAFLLGLGDQTIWDLGSRIFTPPCLWLNDHFFHYKYIPQIWSPFSGALHTIRDIMYLLFSAVGCIVWSIAGKHKDNHNKLFYWFSQCMIPVIASLIFTYGISKLIPVQMRYPNFIDAQKQVGDLSPFELIWLGLGYGQPYQVFTGLFEVLGAMLILFRRTRVAGLIIIACVMLNVVILDYSYIVGNVMITAFYIMLVAMFLLAPHAVALSRFFLGQQPASLNKVVYVPIENTWVKLIRVFWVLFVIITCTMNIAAAWRIYVRREQIRETEQCSLVKNHVINGTDSTGQWQSWYERVRDGKRLVTVTTKVPGADENYSAQYDSLQGKLTLRPMGQKDTTALVFNYRNIDKANWCLEGQFHQQNVRVNLQRVNPDTAMTLFKMKRVVIIFDDYSDQE